MASKTMLHAPNGSLGPQQRPGLGRQGSIYALTLEELQNSMIEQGKIGSMNMDEFMKNVWTAEESQAMFTSASASAPGGGGNEGTAASSQPPPLQRQPSMSIPRTLSQKTVDEVWKEIQVQKQQQQQQELSYGEITLEDFLIRAGVVKEDTDAAGVMPPMGPQGTLQEPMSQNQQQADWYNYQMKQQHLLQQQAAEAAAFGKRSPVGNLILPAGPAAGYFDGSYEGGPLTPGNLALSPGLATPDMPSKKRSLDLVVEKTVERRQRRMIKNRESAARSRARKQAYTVELEAEVTQLKEENTRLKRWQAEEAERRRRQITEILAQQQQQQQEKQQQQQQEKQKQTELRRCRSLP